MKKRVIYCSLLFAVCLPTVDLLGQIHLSAFEAPDLSGTYDTATLTPLERPVNLGDRLYLTEEEAVAVAEGERAFIAAGSQISDGNRSAPAKGGSTLVGQKDFPREAFGAGSVGGYNVFWADRGSQAFSIDGEYRTSIIVDPPNGRKPPLTTAGEEFAAFRRSLFRPNTGEAWWLDLEGPGPYDDPERRPPAERCLMGFGSTQGPPMLPVLYNNHKRIIQTPEYVMILVEMVHDARIIRLNSEHPPTEVRKWLGDSIGHWEGETLIVDTTNFTDGPGLLGATRNLHVIERFQRMGEDDLLYSFTVEDEGTWTDPWSGEYLWPGTDNKVYEYACHEGNYAMGNILRGARLLEAEVAVKAGAGH